MTQPNLINLHPNEYSQGLRYYPFAVNLDKCVESCNILNDISNRVCVPNKTKDLNSHVFNIISRIRESKNINKAYHVNAKINLMVENLTQIKSGITVNVCVSVKFQTNMMCVKKIIFGILLHVAVKMVNM